jgi:hypothetical protein
VRPSSPPYIYIYLFFFFFFKYIYIYLKKKKKKKKKKRIDNKKQSLVSKFTYLFGLWPLRFFER